MKFIFDDPIDNKAATVYVMNRRQTATWNCDDQLLGSQMAAVSSQLTGDSVTSVVYL